MESLVDKTKSKKDQYGGGSSKGCEGGGKLVASGEWKKECNFEIE